MCAPKPPKPKKVTTPPPQYLVNPLTDNLGTRGFLDARAGRSSLVIRPGSTGPAGGAAPQANPGFTTVLPTAVAPTNPLATIGKKGSLFRGVGRALASK